MVCSLTQLRPAFKPPPSISVSLESPETYTRLTTTDLAVITGIFLASYNVGSAIGNTISGAIWTQVLPGELENRLGNATLAGEVYANPFTFALANPVGTPDRDAVVLAYKHAQKLLCITGICLTVPLIVFSLCIRNPRLTKEQSLEKAEESDEN